MKNKLKFITTAIEYYTHYFSLGMRAKLIILFIGIKIIPLILLACLAWHQSWLLGDSLRRNTEELAYLANEALSKTGDIAVTDAVKALDDRAREDIERMSTDVAQRVANFLYSRDADITYAATISPDYTLYKNFITNKQGRLAKSGTWILAPDGKSWQQVHYSSRQLPVTSSIKENNSNFSYRPSDGYEYENRPLYLEMTFIDLNGQEQVKVTTSSRMDSEPKNISLPQNTFVKAEYYFTELQKLKPGQIYVSDVIGAYVGSYIIGTYTPESARQAKIPYAPEQSAYAGKENPLGKRFAGLVRWATPVTKDDEIIGYVTLALDHDHLMEFTAHEMPTNARYTLIPDASEGNYAFIWDYKGRNIVHPRHFSIAGYNPETGEPQIPWLEDRIYNEWQASGKAYLDFIDTVPIFMEQSQTKRAAPELTDQGLVGLDCRYLNFAPQCTGWFDLTKYGGSGSFLILWSDLWKLTTAATIPYYTGQYADSPRGFGFVAIGAGVEDFHRPAMDTKAVIDQLLTDSDQTLQHKVHQAVASIHENLIDTASSLSISTILMCILVVLIAIWLASIFTQSITTLTNGLARFKAGERHFRFKSTTKDELGLLADSFDEMADSLVDSVKTTLIITNMESKVIYANELASHAINKTLPEIIGNHYPEISIFPAHSEYCPLHSLLQGNESEIYYVEFLNLYMKGHAAYLNDKEGNNIGYIITATDVTDMVNEQKKIEEQKALLDTVLDSSPDLIWYQNSAGQFLLTNPRFASVTGKQPEELYLLTPEDVLNSDLAKGFSSKNAAVTTSCVATHYVENIIFADGHREILDTVRVPLLNTKGKCIGILGVARDMSLRVEVEHKLRQAQSKLKKAVFEANKANLSKSEFLARMSHEIRTPMNAILGMSSITQRKLDYKKLCIPEIKEHIQHIEVAAKHLLGLINDILDISKIEAGKLELHAESFDLTHLINSVVDIIKPRCLEKGLDFILEYTPSLESVYVNDALRLRQVLLNLLGNAVKFTPEKGQLTFKIEQKSQEEDQTLLKFSIQDTGIGISQQSLANLFLPFEQANSEITKQFGGTGLGLSISQRIVNLMQGNIIVESQKDMGSTFSFELWLKKGSPLIATATVTEQIGSFADKKLLLVDDMEINRMIVVELLGETNILIDEAADGSEALEIFTKSPEYYYDIILMDIQMPTLDGYQTTKAIRALNRPDALLVPIIALTANAFKEDEDKAYSHGMTAYLSKPIECDRLMDTLQTHIFAVKEVVFEPEQPIL